MIRGFKAFDKNLSCNGFAFEVGKTYKHEGPVKLCESGFHFCQMPLDVLDFKDLINSRFAEVSAKAPKSDEKKSVTAEIEIKKEVGIAGLVKAQVEILFSFAFNKGGNDTKETVSDEKDAQLAASGDSAKLAASGDSAQLAADGKHGVAAGIGYKNTAKGAEGNWLVLAEWEYDEKDTKTKPVCVKVERVGENGIKPDVFYALKDGVFVEVS